MQVWEIRRVQARKFAEWGEVLKNSGQIEGAFYLFHMSVELLMKAAIARRHGGWHPTDPDSHILIRLVSNSRTQFIFADMADDQNTNVHFQFVQLNSQNKAWRMQYRYEGTKLGAQEMAKSVEIYGEIFGWIQKNYMH